MLAPEDGQLPSGLFAFYNTGNDRFTAQLTHRHVNDQSPSLQDDGTYFSVLSEAHNSNAQHCNTKNSSMAQPSTFGRDCDPALNTTIRENATEAALVLLDYGASVEAENSKGITPLIMAAQKGNAVVIKELLRRGSDPSHASANGTTAVLQASHFGHLHCLQILLQTPQGSALVETANYNHTTPLMRAAQEGHLPVVQILLKYGASVNRRNRVQMSALMLASQRGHADVCRALVDKGAALDSMTLQNATSLSLACKRGHVQVVKVLVTAGGELWIQDSRGRCAREIAQRRDMKEIVELLDSNVQLDLMQRQQRKQRNFTIVLLWNLLQQERATIPVQVDDGCNRQLTIHQMEEELRPTRNASLQLSMMVDAPLPPTLPYQLSKPSTQALLRTMTLPAPLVEHIAKFIPLPMLWERRVGILTRRSVMNADATVCDTLDLIDEILEMGGFVDALDFVKVTPPTYFATWVRLHVSVGMVVHF